MNLHDTLCQDHARLDRSLEELLNRIHVGDTLAADASWLTLERGVLDHLEAEEKWMLPTFDARAPAEAATIRADHATIRGLLAELGVALELHTLREETALQLAAFLRAHAAREEGQFYAFGESEMSPDAKEGMIGRLSKRPTPNGGRRRTEPTTPDAGQSLNRSTRGSAT